MFRQLMQVKKLISLLLTIVFCYLSIIGKITPTQYISVFSLIISFYFGQSSARQIAYEKTLSSDNN